MGVRRESCLFPADASAAGRARTGRPVRSCAGFRSSGAAAAYAGMHDAQHLGDHHRLRLTRGDRPACRCAARYRPVDGGGFLDAGNRAHPQDVLRPVRHDTNDAARGERAGERVSAASQRHGLRPDRRLRRCGELFGHVCPGAAAAPGARRHRVHRHARVRGRRGERRCTQSRRPQRQGGGHAAIAGHGSGRRPFSNPL